MQNLSDLVWQIGWFVGVVATAAMGQTPTLSLELVEINSIPLCGGGVSRMTVAPRDTLIAKVFVRDWSPNSEEMRAYQAELDHSSFTSGTAGSIQPVGYQTTTLSGLQNLKNAFIDLTNPKYVHFGEQAVALANSGPVSPGYRWLSVLVMDGGPVSRQDGTKFYCGTLKLFVSEDAEGTFTIALNPGSEESSLRTPTGDWIEPLELEPLTLVVTPGERPVWIRSSAPKDGSIDARWLSPERGQRGSGWQKIELTFSAELGSLSAGDFTIEDETAAPPRIVSVKSSGEKATLAFNRPIARGTWTTITHTGSGTRARLGRFPGDVNNDGGADPRDLRLLIDGLNGVVPLPVYRTDLDDDGTSGASDVLQLLTALNEG